MGAIGNEMSPVTRRAIVGGTLKFRLPYCGDASFDWWLDASGRDVIVACVSPWKGLRTDRHQIGMGPKFSPQEARQIGEALARRIIANVDYVVCNRNKGDLAFDSYYDTQQLPLYRKWAWEEAKRRFLEVGLLAETFKDDDADDDSPENVLLEDHLDRAEDELKQTRVEVIAEQGPLSGEALKKIWRLA